MKKIFYLFIVLFPCVFLQAQYTVTFILKENRAIPHDSIYVAGTFNNWDANTNPVYLMKPHGEKEKSITLNLKAGAIQYKFHRGNWRTAEQKSNGDQVANREIIIRKDTVLMDTVSNWRDQFFIDIWQALSRQIPDTTRFKLLDTLTKFYAYVDPNYYNSDSALYYAQQALQLVEKMKATKDDNKRAEAGNSAQLIDLQEVTALLLHSLGNYPRALEMRLENLKLAEKEKDKYKLVWALGNITADYLSMKDYRSMLNYAKQQDSVLATLDATGNRHWRNLFWSKTNVATAYYRLNNLSPALTYVKQALSIDSIDVTGLVYGRQLLADIYSAMNESDSALRNYRYVITAATNWTGLWIPIAQAGMAKVFQKTNQADSALFYGRQALNNFQNNKLDLRSWGENSLFYIAEISPLLAELFKSNNQPDSAYKYLQLSVAAKDSLYNTDKVRQFQTLGFNEANRRLQLEQQSREEKQRYETKIKMYGLIGIITGFIVLAFVLYRNNRHKQKANTLLHSQKQEIETTLGELKNTQKQLIQSEKMASLGELTAGIAHEIQNPLNFVNNFAEVNSELIAEMKHELDNGKINDAKTIAITIDENEQKIIFHGKRADTIVKGMLMHSRSSSGVKEPTDINALADEYLRLAYHGLRAKDKSFNATMKTDFDESIGLINIVPQDIGRVILNLITNAFYAVSAPNPSTPLPPVGGKKNEATVSVTTKLLLPPTGGKGVEQATTEGSVEIRVKDNGPGIPKNVIDKIFQPFFTTKPTGQGTGLGLSLSYDIIKAHGGELKVETKEGEGSEFIIQLPLN